MEKCEEVNPYEWGKHYNDKNKFNVISIDAMIIKLLSIIIN